MASRRRSRPSPDRSTPCAASTSTSPPARSSACSDRTAPARPRRCGCSPPCSTPSAGTATVAGADLLRESREMRRRIGYVAQVGGDPRRRHPRRRGARRAGPPAGDGKAAARARVAELAPRLDLAGLEGRDADRALGRPAPALRRRARADALAAARLPRRADDRASTRRAAPTSGSTSARCATTSASRSCSPRTTSTRPTRWPTAARHRPRRDRRRRHAGQPQGRASPATSISLAGRRATSPSPQQVAARGRRVPRQRRRRRPPRCSRSTRGATAVPPLLRALDARPPAAGVGAGAADRRSTTSS